MDTQIWSGPQEPRDKLFCTPVMSSGGMAKPVQGTGMWTSTWDGKLGAWLEWCHGERWGPWRQYPLWLLDVRPEARVFEIATGADMKRFIKTYAMRDPVLKITWLIHWDLVAEKWDGVHLADYGLHWKIKDLGQSMIFYGWDCECTLWTRWMFDNVRRAELPMANEPPYPKHLEDSDGASNQ
jgi:hypothetical protein